MDATDVMIVGGGIAGASLALALADGGLGVTVLEASTEYEDRVRGESMHAWGVKEARELGAEQVLLDAGAHVAPVWKQYTEGAVEPAELPMSLMVPGVEGSLNLRHPDACQALADAATDAGATVVRGVRDVKLNGGSPVTVSYGLDGSTTSVRAGLVIGADGRASTVRKQIGVELERSEAIGVIAGLLLDGIELPDDHDQMVAEGDQFKLVFHQGGGRARTYVAAGLSAQRTFSGRESSQRYLDAWRSSGFDWATDVASATPAGPCATYPGDDTWTPTPFAEGVVLIGDAAGHNDPIIGEGLSIAMRDARTVRDLVLGGARTPADFHSYADERVERMRRLRLLADIISVTMVEDGAANRDARRAWLGERMGAMDPEVFPLVAATFAGPETIPDELVDEGILDRIRAA